MKKVLSLSLVFVLLLLLCTSCRKDDDNTETLKNLGYISVDGTQYKITQGIIQGFKSTSNSHNNDYSVTLQSVDGTTTRGVTLSINFPYNDNINGTFTLNGATKKLDGWLSNYTYTQGTNMDSSNNLSQGTCTVTRNSNTNFKITFSIKPANGKTITGEFNGDANVQEATY